VKQLRQEARDEMVPLRPLLSLTVANPHGAHVHDRRPYSIVMVVFEAAVAVVAVGFVAVGCVAVVPAASWIEPSSSPKEVGPNHTLCT